MFGLGTIIVTVYHIILGGDFRVDVHRKESSSSSPNSCHSVTNDSWKTQTHHDKSDHADSTDQSKSSFI